MTQKLVIIRGLPGSGKSTIAKSDPYKGFKHFEADMYFINDKGEYVFDKAKISKAHKWCQDSCRTALAEGYSVVVSNTFCRMWEMIPYLQMAGDLDIPVEVVEAKGEYKNIHDCPKETIGRMKANWEAYEPPPRNTPA